MAVIVAAACRNPLSSFQILKPGFDDLRLKPIVRSLRMDTAAPIRHLHDERDLRASRDENPNFAGTLAKGLMILQAFVREPRPLANSELASRLKLPRPTVSRLCRTLLEMGYLDHDSRIDRYFIGPAAMALGYPYIVNTPLIEQSRGTMQALAEQVQGAVSIGIALDLDVVYIETCARRRGTLARPAVGATRAVAATAMGRAWLATLGKRERAALLQRMRKERPDEMRHCAAGLEDSLAHHGERGFAVNLGDMGMGVHAVGVASRVRYGARTLLFNCAVPRSALRPGDLIERIGPRLLEIVRLVERDAGLR
jgi:DNA-binding IclR family transcriptional regulator